MIQVQNQHSKTAIQERLARIEGQLRGVQKMIDEGRDCQAIVQQLIAIRAAVQSASLSFVQDAAEECLLAPEAAPNHHDQHQKLAELVKMLGKLT